MTCSLLFEAQLKKQAAKRMQWYFLSLSYGAMNECVNEKKIRIKGNSVNNSFTETFKKACQLFRHTWNDKTIKTDKSK